MTNIPKLFELMKEKGITAKNYPKILVYHKET